MKRFDAMKGQATPKAGSRREIYYEVAECANCGGPLRSVHQTQGISGIPLWTHSNGSSIPNYDCVIEHEKSWKLTTNAGR